MKEREEKSIKWGEKGLKWGGTLGAGLGVLNYNAKREAFKVYEQRYCSPTSPTYTPNHVAPSYFRPKRVHFALPLVATAVLVGGTGYVAGKVYEKIQYPKTHSTPSRQEKWANNSFKVGAGVGFGISCIVNHVARNPILITSVATAVVAGIGCAGVGLFAGTVANKLKDDTNTKRHAPKL